MSTNRQNDFISFALASARQQGFECCGLVSTGNLMVNPEVRSMCAANRCQAYDKSWMCPPACGDIEVFATRIAQHSDCVVVQTVATLEDEFDYESMIEAETVHKKRFAAFVQDIRASLTQDDGINRSDAVQIQPFPLAAGGCTVCPTCSYPDEPCRYPDQAFVSMEAAGLLVSEICEAAGIPYYHGKGTMSYTSCMLL